MRAALVLLALVCGVVLPACLNVTPYPTIDSGSGDDAGGDADGGADAGGVGDGGASPTAPDGGVG